MKCLQCDAQAHAVCKFCGRAVCRNHVQEKPYATGYSTATGFWTRRKNAVRVPDAVWCGSCHPEHHATA
jgi:hypothetical protein